MLLLIKGILFPMFTDKKNDTKTIVYIVCFKNGIMNLNNTDRANAAESNET